MDIGVDQVVGFEAGGAFTAGIWFKVADRNCITEQRICSVAIAWFVALTNNILSESKGESQCPTTFLAQKEQGMAEAVGGNQVEQVLLDRLLTGNILEAHGAKIRESRRAARNEPENLFSLIVLILNNKHIL